MNQRFFIRTLLSIFIVGNLLFIAQSTQAGFFDWFSWSKIKSVFTEEKIQEGLPASVSEPVKEVLPIQEPQETATDTSNPIETPKCSTCECPQCPVSPKPQTCEPIIKEVPVEKIVYRDKIIYQDSLDLRLAISACNQSKEDNRLLYLGNEGKLISYMATTADFKVSYSGLLAKFDETINLIFELNRDYLFQPSISSQVLGFRDFASTSRAFIGKFK